MTNPNPLIRVTQTYATALAVAGKSDDEQREIFGDGMPRLIQVSSIISVNPAIDRPGLRITKRENHGESDRLNSIVVTESLDEIEARIERAVFGPPPVVNVANLPRIRLCDIHGEDEAPVTGGPSL